MLACTCRKHRTGSGALYFVVQTKALVTLR
jgi:hypothetical protein